MYMNRKQFLKTCITGCVLSPMVIMSNNTKPNPEPNLKSIHPILECTYKILHRFDYEMYNIKYNEYCSTCVDYRGRFYGEDGYDNSRSEPFVVKGYRISCLPKIYSTKKSDIDAVLGKINSGVILQYGNGGYTKQNIINEIKEKMAYVCFAGYALTKNEYDEEFFIPMVRGLYIKRYNQFIEGMSI